MYYNEYGVIKMNDKYLKNADIVKEIMNLMENIEYGFLDKNNHNIFLGENIGKRFNQEYHLMSPQELLQKKVGVCWDQVELERKLFIENNIKNSTYFIYIDDKQSLSSHSFLVFSMNNKIYWFEHSWFDEKGVHEYNNIKDLLNDVKSKFIKSRENELPNFFKLYIYKYDKPKYNISCDEFYNYINTQEKIEEINLEDSMINKEKKHE